MQITEVELGSYSVWLLLQDGGQVGKPRGTAECQYFPKDFTKRASPYGGDSVKTISG